MITAKEAANITANYNLSTMRTLESVENAISSAAAQGNTFVILDRHTIPHEVLYSLINNGYNLEVYNDTTVVSWNKYYDIAVTLINHKQIIDNSSSADDINNRYYDTKIEDITPYNIESWISKYIYSGSDRFSNDISCGTKFFIYDGIYNAQWVVVGADTELNKGDIKLTKPQLSLVPVTGLGGYEAPMNNFFTASGAYADSKMNKETIPAIVEALQKVLSNHLLARRVKLANSTDNKGKSNGSAYYTVYANLMCERQVFGKSTYENSYDIGDDTTALPGISFNDKIYGHSYYFWLRSVYNSVSFVRTDGDGDVDYSSATFPFSVRPLITIG